MSTGNPSGTWRHRMLSPTTRFMLLTWVLLIGGAWVLVKWMDKSNKSMWDDLTATKNSLQELYDASKKNSVDELRKDAESVFARLDSLENALQVANSSAKPAIDTAPSAQAVERAKALELAAQLTTLRQNLLKLKAQQATWQAVSASVSTGDLGRRIVASPAHFGLAIELMDQERPSLGKIEVWEAQLATLAEPVENSAQTEKPPLGITIEHAQLLTDLNRQVLQAVHSFEEQQFLLEAISKETASVTPLAKTFDEVVRERNQASLLARNTSLNAVREEARIEAEQAHRDRVAQLEKELVQTKTKNEELTKQAEKFKLETLAQLEREQIAEETRVKEAEQRAINAGLKEEVNRLDEAILKAELEREFNRDLPKIQGYLSFFTSDGYSYRADDTKGPVSLALLKGRGALNSTSEGLQQLFTFVWDDNERPRGAVPSFYKGIEAHTKTLETVQALLTKYGDLMVAKGLLAP